MSAAPRIGSLFSGYGGLEMGVQIVLGGSTAWHVEFDAAPSKVLARRWPGVPNYGDVRAVEWAAIEPVDVLTGGFPCQDVSLAGRRAGITAGSRSGLWSEFARAIDVLRPGLVVIENVRGLLSAAADGVLEPDPWGLGDGATRPVVNALGVVLGDLAGLGYDAVWCGVRAADAGAPHGRFRVFIAAHPSGSGGGRWTPKPGTAGLDDAALRSGARGAGAGDAAADSERVERAWERRAIGRFTAAARRRDVTAADAGRDEPERRRGHGDVARSSGAGEGARDQRQRDGDAALDRGAAPTDAQRGGCDGRARFEEWSEGERADAARPGEDLRTAWGEYAPAVERWELVTGRPAPAPTNPDGKNDGHRLSAAFVEWMMGLPAGHVTSPEVGLKRAEQLKALGNGVVPQQAALAVRTLLPLLDSEAVAA